MLFRAILGWHHDRLPCMPIWGVINRDRNEQIFLNTEARTDFLIVLRKLTKDHMSIFGKYSI